VLQNYPQWRNAGQSAGADTAELSPDLCMLASEWIKESPEGHCGVYAIVYVTLARQACGRLIL